MIDNVLNELYQLNAICVVEQARTHQRVSYLHGKWLVPRTLRSGQRRIYLAGSVRIRISHRRSLWQCRRHGLTLDRYNKELGSVSELSFRKRYELGSFVEEGKTPFKEWDFVVLCQSCSTSTLHYGFLWRWSGWNCSTGFRRRDLECKSDPRQMSSTPSKRTVWPSYTTT